MAWAQAARTSSCYTARPARPAVRRPEEGPRSLLRADDDGRRGAYGALEEPSYADLWDLLTENERAMYFDLQKIEAGSAPHHAIRGDSREEKAEMKEEIQGQALGRLSYDEKLNYCDRPEQIDGPSPEAWAEINAHLGTATSLPELVRELGNSATAAYRAWATRLRRRLDPVRGRPARVRGLWLRPQPRGRPADVGRAQHRRWRRGGGERVERRERVYRAVDTVHEWGSSTTSRAGGPTPTSTARKCVTPDGMIVHWRRPGWSVSARSLPSWSRTRTGDGFDIHIKQGVSKKGSKRRSRRHCPRQQAPQPCPPGEPGHRLTLSRGATGTGAASVSGRTTISCHGPTTSSRNDSTASAGWRLALTAPGASTTAPPRGRPGA